MRNLVRVLGKTIFAPIKNTTELLEFFKGIILEETNLQVKNKKLWKRKIKKDIMVEITRI